MANYNAYKEIVRILLENQTDVDARNHMMIMVMMIIIVLTIMMLDVDYP